MSTIERADLLAAAKAVRAAQGAREAREATREQLEAVVRSSPLWATIPNPPAAGERITRHHLEALIRAARVAEALGLVDAT